MSTDFGPVAVLGMGRMGAAMVGKLRRAGFDVVVYNRTQATAEVVASKTGATVAATPAEAVSEAKVVISMLADDASVTDVQIAASPGLQEGAVVLEMSTIDPQTLDTVRPSIEAGGASLLDAPVSGSVPQVEAGTLTIMVGGDAASLELARPVLEPLAATIVQLGESGSGATIKLAVNSIIHSLNVAVSEALVLAEKAGVERSKAYGVFASSAAAAPFVHYKRDAFEHPEQAEVAFSLDLVGKDLDLILELGERVGAPMHQGTASREVVRQAVDSGFAERDLSAVASYLRDVPPR